MTIATDMAAIKQQCPAHDLYPAATVTAILGTDVLALPNVRRFNLAENRPAGPLSSAGPGAAAQTPAAAWYVSAADVIQYIHTRP